MMLCSGYDMIWCPAQDVKLEIGGGWKEKGLICPPNCPGKSLWKTQNCLKNSFKNLSCGGFPLQFFFKEGRGGYISHHQYFVLFSNFQKIGSKKLQILTVRLLRCFINILESITRKTISQIKFPLWQQLPIHHLLPSLSNLPDKYSICLICHLINITFALFALFATSSVWK